MSSVGAASVEVDRQQPGTACPICQFLGKNPAPAPALVHGQSTILVETLTSLAPPSRAAEPHRVPLIRGPPLVV